MHEPFSEKELREQKHSLEPNTQDTENLNPNVFVLLFLYRVFERSNCRRILFLQVTHDPPSPPNFNVGKSLGRGKYFIFLCMDAYEQSTLKFGGEGLICDLQE